MRKYLCVLLSVAIPFLSFSQENWEGGFTLGYTNYLGDMVDPTFTFDQANLAGGAFLRYHFSNNFALRSNLLIGKIDGADVNYERLASRGTSFESGILEFSFMGEYDILGHKRWGEEGHFQRMISPYVFTGAGVALINPESDLNIDGQPNEAKMEDLAADFSDVNFVLPLGLGLKYDVSRNLNIGVEWGMKLTFSDYLDGLSLAGDPDDNDVYIFGGIVAGLKLDSRDQDRDGVADNNDKCPNLPGPPKLEGCPDADLDGIADLDDKCPNTPGTMRFEGCPDTDGDGIADYLDDCPDDAGLKRFGGCPDTDADGIVDQEDNCPETAGIPSMNGCPDADRDGVRDSRDECPDEPGPITLGGCPDSDGDGIVDAEDDCPRVPGKNGIKGCPDMDRDGIADHIDKCPELAGLVANSGCPEINKEDKETLDFAMKNVRFETGSANLLSASKKILDEIAVLMSRYPGYGLAINGYTDNVGNDTFNQQLSERRAKACLDYLMTKGVSSGKLSYAGFGEKNPIADNSTIEGRRQNRRVEFSLKPQ